MITIKKLCLLVLLLSLALTFTVAGTELKKVQVAEVVDGVTIKVESRNGANEKVRYVGIETLEIHEEDERYVEEAASYNKCLVKDKTVWLELEEEKRDNDDRLLAYVYLDPSKNSMVNAIMAAQGYVKVVPKPPNVKYADRLKELAADARDDDRGLWDKDFAANGGEEVANVDDCIEVLNDAGQEDFEEIVGIGEGIAERLVDAQPYDSSCSSVECVKSDLTEVYYVGDETSEEILSHFCPELLE